ncbi:MAG: DUF3558 domain-containing protein, partial [Chloroflexota bacterium]
APAKPATTAAQTTQAPATANTPAPAGQTKPECPVLTKQEVEAALAKSVLNADTLITEGSLISCSYRDPKSPASILAGLIVKSDPQAKLGYQTRKSGATDPKAIAGLGDDAFWEEAADNLEVLKGNNAITLTIGKGATADRLKAAQDLAAKVLAKLPAAGSSSAPAKATAAPSKAADLDVCSLLTNEEVVAVVGKTVEPVRTTGTGGLFGCSYQDSAHKPDSLVDLTIYMLTPTEAKGMYEMLRNGAPQRKAIAGLGDDAYWNDELGDTLYVLKGKYVISLDITAKATSDNLKAAQTLAPKALSRLP